MLKHPNILFIMADELRSDVTGFTGNTVVRTKNLDKLAEKATIFSNAYTPSPICIPARQCIAAGQFTTTCNCKRWFEDLPEGYLTFPRLLSQHGYTTVACGKLHHVGPDQMQGYTRRFGMEAEVVDCYIPDIKQEEDMFVSKWTQDMEVANATSGVKTWHIRQDEIATESAEYFIEQYFSDPHYKRNTPEKPLLLTVSFNQPHYPYIAEPQLLDYYMDKVPVYTEQEVFDHSFLSMFQVPETEQALRKATAAYYAMTETMDGYVGRVVDALEKVGQNLDDWMVVFTSDHGEMLGEHGVWEKQKFFEGSAKVPFFVKLPQQQENGECDKNINTCDIFSTICETTNIEKPHGLDSNSICGLIKNKDSQWENETMCTFGGTNIMIKKDALKYQYYEIDNSEVLFDLERDASEKNNYMNDARYKEDIAYFRTRIETYGFHYLIQG